MKILWWGRFDPNYSRNGVIREVLRAKGCEIVDFHPRFSKTGDLEAVLKKLETPSFVWVPCFRQRDLEAAARWAKAREVPLIFDPLISAYEKRVEEFGKVEKDSARARRLLRWERKVFARADIVLADTTQHARYYEEVLGVDPRKIRIVYVGAQSCFKPSESVKKEAFEVLFYGSFLPLHGPEVIVEAAKSARDLPIKWTLIGDGPLRQECLKLAEGCDNIRFETHVDYAELPRRINAADVLLGIFGSTEKAARVMPNKFFQAIASGKPIITRESDAYPEGSRNAPAVKFIASGDSAALCSAVRAWYEDRESLEAAASNARKVYAREFGLEVIARQLDLLFTEVKRMKVSVIVPVYNVEQYLKRCLDSILAAAKFANEVETEIICVNDGSTDGSAAVLETYSDRVKIITQENKGLGPARNAGLDVMTGDFVMFVDSDDFIPEDAIAKLTKVAVDSGLPLVVSLNFAKSAPTHRDSAVKWRVRPNRWIVGKRVEYSACNKLYAAPLFKTRRYWPILHEDYPVTTGVFCDVESFAAVEEPMYVYCDNGTSSIIRSPYSKRKLKDKLFGVKEILKIDSAFAGDIPMRQAVKGLSTVIGKVAKAKDPMLVKLLIIEVLRFSKDCPKLLKKLPLKAKFRLWRMKKGVGVLSKADSWSNQKRTGSLVE